MENQPDDFDSDSNAPANKNPYVLVSSFYTVTSFFENYGWFLFFAVILLMVVWTNLQNPIKKILGRQKPHHSVTDFMSPDQVEARMRAMDKARQKMQEQYDRLVEERAEKLKKQEEQKRLQKIHDHEALKQGQTQSGTLHKMEIKSDPALPTSTIKRNKDSKPLRNSDFNPLAGSSNTTRWRRSTSRNTRGG